MPGLFHKNVLRSHFGGKAKHKGEGRIYLASGLVSLKEVAAKGLGRGTGLLNFAETVTMMR